MSNFNKNERFLFGYPSILNYVQQPYPVRKAGTLDDHGRERNVLSVDSYKSSGYFYSIQLCLDVKKAGHVDPLSVDIECLTTQCFPCDQTTPGISWAIMEAIKPYRRFSPRRLFYIATTTLPAEPLQPVISSGRDPPTNQTQQGVIVFPLCQRKTLTGGNLLGI